MINHASQGGIYWTIQTCLTNLKFSEHLLFANLNDFSLKSTDFIKDSQMQVVYFCKFFFYKNQFSQKNVLCLIKLPGGNFWTIQTCFTNLEFSSCLLFADLIDFPQKLTEFMQYERMRVRFFLGHPLHQVIQKLELHTQDHCCDLKSNKFFL